MSDVEVLEENLEELIPVNDDDSNESINVSDFYRLLVREDDKDYHECLRQNNDDLLQAACVGISGFPDETRVKYSLLI